jgi:hypothetical protein
VSNVDDDAALLRRFVGFVLVRSFDDLESDRTMTFLLTFAHASENELMDRS